MYALQLHAISAVIVTAALALTDGLRCEEPKLLMFVSSSCLTTLSTFCASWSFSPSCGAIVRAIALLICQVLDTSSNIDAARDASSVDGYGLAQLELAGGQRGVSVRESALTALGGYCECAWASGRVVSQGLRMPSTHQRAAESLLAMTRSQPLREARSEVAVPDSIWAVDNEGLEFRSRYSA